MPGFRHFLFLFLSIDGHYPPHFPRVQDLKKYYKHQCLDIGIIRSHLVYFSALFDPILVYFSASPPRFKVVQDSK